MATFNTPIGKVRYSGVFKFVLAIPANDTKIGTRVIQRSNSGIKLIEALRTCRSGVVLNSTAMPGSDLTLIAYKMPGDSIVRGDSDGA